MSSKKWFKGFLILLLAALVLTAGVVAFVDPFFHYGAPKDYFYYKLYDQRSQNDGITRNFSYDAIITGTSMAENFKASLFDECFGTDSIKVTYAGATYKEIDSNLRRSYESGHDPKYVFRVLDYSLLIKDKDEMRIDMGEYPTWLTNRNPFDDVKYLLNRDVILSYTLPVLLNYVLGGKGGHTSFDEYSYNGDINEYGREIVFYQNIEFNDPEVVNSLTEEELLMVSENVEQNVVSLAREHPETTFIYFFPPYSMAYWGQVRTEGNLTKQVECVEKATELMLECDNIHVYSFAFEEDVTSDLELYKDVAHYRPEINDLIMSKISELEKTGNEMDEAGVRLRLTKDNYKEFYKTLLEYLENYDYKSL
jgi:hypothetical protein